MATLTSKITLTSSDTATDALSLIFTKALTVGAPSVGISKAIAPAEGSADITIVPAAAANRYVYVRHTGKKGDETTTATGGVKVQFGSTDSIRLSSDEWAFFPAANVDVKVESSNPDTVAIEYGYWTKG